MLMYNFNQSTFIEAIHNQRLLLTCSTKWKIFSYEAVIEIDIHQINFNMLSQNVYPLELLYSLCSIARY